MMDRLQEEQFDSASDARYVPAPGNDWPERFDFVAFFTGRVRGWGLFQDRFGKVRKEFTVDMFGEWRDDVFHLREDFVYRDGGRQQRVWHVTRNADGTYRATAADIVGAAQGTADATHMRWLYDLRVPVGGRKIVMRFDDRMFLQPDGVLMNVSDASKFGFRLGRLAASFKKVR